MPAPKHALRYALSACAIAGLDLTLERHRVIHLLSEGEGFWCVETLVREVAASTGVHPVTVYRFISDLEAHGVVRRLSLQGRRAILLACESADFLVCRGCGVVRRIPEPEGFRFWEQSISQSTGFRVAHHWYEISGVCPDCELPGVRRDNSQTGSLRSAGDPARR